MPHVNIAYTHMPPSMFLSVDNAANTLNLIIERILEGNGWDKISLEGTDIFVAHVERDGVVWGSGKRAAEETPERAKNSIIRLRFRPNQHMGNHFGALHGAYSAGIVDILSTLVLVLHTSGEAGSPWSTLGVSNIITLHYMLPTTVGRWIEFEARTLRVGRSQALIAVDIYELDGRDGKRVRHTITATHAKSDVPGTAISKL